MITDNKRELTQTVNGQTTSFEYDTMGRQTKVTAPGNVVTNTTYYPTGEVKRVDGATYPVEYTYNGLGMQATLKTFKDADTPQVTSWSYNNRGQMTAKTYADNSSVTYTYNGDGQLLTRTWARDIVATYTYDAAGRMTGLSYSDNTPSIAVTYNFLDQPVTITDAAGTRTLTYNAQSRLENETIPGIMDNMVNSYSYDAYGRLILRQLTTTGTAQAVSGIAYDVKGRVASVGNGADTLHYAYRPGLNRLATATWRNSQNAELNSRTYAYDTYHRLTGINLNNVSEVTYTLNAKDQRTAASYAVGGAWSYSYDEKSQVTGATGNNTTYSYTYDGIGNRLTAAEGSNTWSYTSNLLNQYTAINSNQPTYDADGNMLTTGDGWLYTWNGENRLIRAENSDTLVEMAYDYMGRRIEKKVSSKGVLSFYSWSLEKHYKFAYDGYKLIAIYDAANNNALLMTFTWQPESAGLDVPVSMTCDGNTYYYVTDGNKNVTGLLDQAGTRVAEYVYGPFGQLLSAEGELADVNPFRFSSEYADDETGLVYYNYRYYSPQLGRWTKRDPIEEKGGVNLYNMCNNSTITNMDLLGFFLLVSDLENPTYFYNLTSSYSPDEEKMRRERLLNQLRNLFLDEEGFQIFSRWVRGEGAWLDAPFGNYLMKSPTIKNEVQDVLEDELEKNKNIRNNSYFNIRKSIDIVLPDNGYNTGYQLLHGTNRTVGGFKIAGKILKRTRNCFSGEMRYSWNDIIDPNPKYIKDIILYIGAQILFSGSPRDYVIRIPFNAKFDAIHSSMAGGKVTYWLFYGFPGATSLND